MPSNDADRIGPKGHVYVELVREQYRAPLERGSVRRSLATALLAIALVILGVVGAWVANPEALVAVAVGGVALFSSLPELQALRPEFEESRRIGWVEPSFDDSRVTAGEPATFATVLHARNALTVRGLSLVAEAHQWAGDRRGASLLVLPLPVTLSGSQVAAGDSWRQTVTFRIPDSAPASWYDAGSSVRWTMTMELTFANAEPWRRTWPMLVFPAEAS
ncbi:MAG: hypothetical protein IT355_17160 [Gemmatimonadaceae bacterium]|nr:hypothetical protein [Gemmatimonadaceae bacterium]